MTFSELIPIIRNHLINSDNVFQVEVDLPYTDARMNGDYLISAACDDRYFAYNSNDWLWYKIAGLSYTQTDNILTFYVSYYSTAAEEQQAITALEGLYASLNIANLGKAEGVRAFYNWIADNVIYDSTTKTIIRYTPDGETTRNVGRNSMYDVVVNKHAVCQGIANTMFYFINRYITPCRVIQGNEIGNTYKLYYHCWNIVKLNDEWYWCDATAGVHRHASDPTTQESWLLKNSYDFMNVENAAKYAPLPGYMRNEWLNNYSNISDTSWTF